MGEETVLYEWRARTASAVITINRPDRRNALNLEVASGIAAGIDRALADAACRSIILTGAGDRAFCAGGDLQVDPSGAPMGVDFSDPRHFMVELLRRMIDCRLPIIARINGHALAGGFGLCCACDLAVATDTATFGVPEVRLGIFPMMILPHMLRVVPFRNMMEMCLTGEPITAARALELGIVNHVVAAADLDARVELLSERIGSGSPTGTRIGKMALSAMRDMTIEQSLDYAQVMLQVMASTDDAREGIRAFQEKRRPDWTRPAQG
jgi:enoyl-CoA hydratase/carnithine racemase